MNSFGISKRYSTRLYTLNPHKTYTIAFPFGADEVIAFAAEELQKYLKKISGATFQANRSRRRIPPDCIILSTQSYKRDEVEKIANSARSLYEDGFRIHASPDQIILAGSNARGVLYAVYCFLEKSGCRFFHPGPDGEIVPHHVPFKYPALDLTEFPTFRRRDITEDFRYAIGDDGKPAAQHIEYWTHLIDWMGKNRINTTRNLPDEKYLGEEAKKRGLTSWGGGHILRTTLLPRELFGKHPDYFRMDAAGNRTDDGNLCCSSRAGLKIIARNAEEFVSGHPDIENLNVWGEDIWGGSWCYCPDCSKLSPQAQYMITCNAIAREFKKSKIKIPVVYIAYQDTLTPDISILPESNLRLHWAPRQRSYGKTLSDISSELNRWHVSLLEEWIRIFGASRVDVFEYYGDSLLFWNVPFPMPRVIAGDISFYNSRKINDRILFLKLGDSTWFTHMLNAFTFARMSYNHTEDVETLIYDYYRFFFGDYAGDVKRWFDTFENAVSHVSQWGDIMWAPPMPAFLMEKFQQEAELCLRQLDSAGGILENLAPQKMKSDYQRRLRDLIWLHDLARTQIAGLKYQLKGLMLYGRAQVIRGLRNSPSFTLPIALEPVYAETIANLSKARDMYKSAIAQALESSVEPGSIWLNSERMGFPRLQRLVIEYLESQIRDCSN